MTNYQIKVIKENNRQLVDFANNTPNFVEVVLEIDGQLIKGYCYPPYHHKPIRRMRDGRSLPFSTSGTIRAFVYQGSANYIERDDSDVPAFIHFKINEHKKLSTDDILQKRLARRVKFHRMSDRPEMLEIAY